MTRRWTAEACREALRNFLIESSGDARIRTYDAWRDGRSDLPSTITVTARLGDWVDATNAAAGEIGLDLRAHPSSRHRRWSADECIGALREFVDWAGGCRVEDYRRWRSEATGTCAPSVVAIQRHLGPWRDALVRASAPGQHQIE